MDTSTLTHWITNNGVSEGTLIILVMIPILATIVNISRYIIGLKTFGIYAPIILALAYQQTGLRYGLVLTTVVVASSVVTYKALRSIRMHYLTRIAINYIVLTVTLVGAILFFDNVEVLGLTNFEGINPLMIFSIAALSDFFIKQYVKKDVSKTLKVILETTIVSVIGWYVIQSHPIIQYATHHLWILPMLVLVNGFIGTFEGLRLKDYLRFENISKDE